MNTGYLCACWKKISSKFEPYARLILPEKTQGDWVARRISFCKQVNVEFFLKEAIDHILYVIRLFHILGGSKAKTMAKIFD